ncbi:MAG TPA: hypothetical protein VFQ24_11635 [Terriglobia bacterium]|nr:hypothetical protein [Terriglobia bacterium]
MPGLDPSTGRAGCRRQRKIVVRFDGCDVSFLMAWITSCQMTCAVIMDARIAMPHHADTESLRALQYEIETFIQSLAHPVVVEDEVELFDLASASWKLSIQFEKLLFEAWNPSRTLARRVEEVAYRDGDRLGVFVRKPHARETSVVEFRELHPKQRKGRDTGRSTFRQEFVAMLKQEFQGWRLENISNRSDREHSFSTWYTRGLARQGRTGCAFIGLSKAEPPAAADAAMAFGLIWLDWLRSRSDRTAVPRLRLYLPREAVELNAQRAAAVNRRAVQLEVFEWNGGNERPALVDLETAGDVTTRLILHRPNEALVERHRELLRGVLNGDVDRLTMAADTSGRFVSARVAGLEIARIEGDLSPKIYFGLEGSVRRLNESNHDGFRDFVSRVLDRRSAGSEDAADEFYRLQSERWLESMLVSDITRIDPSFSPEFVYSQVPAFSRTDRGVIDILSVTRDGRLAVIELKLEEQINLPFQALDYWLRVEKLRQEGKFQQYGYFPGMALADAKPLLYLVVPAFRFHSTTTRMLHYLDASVTVMQIGINDQWRRGIKILFRRELRSGV